LHGAGPLRSQLKVVYGGVSSLDDVRLAADVGIDTVQFWAAPYAEAAAITASNSSLVSPVRAIGEAMTQAVRGFSCRLAMRWNARAAGEKGL
jgi:hypothetical protein